MKILKLLNKKYNAILIFYLLSGTNKFAENTPAALWILEKQETSSNQTRPRRCVERNQHCSII